MSHYHTIYEGRLPAALLQAAARQFAEPRPRTLLRRLHRCIASMLHGRVRW